MNIYYLTGTIRTSVVIALVFLTLFSCQRLPKPDFSYTPADNPEAGDTIQFTNLSEEATSYQWEFGDGNSSVLEDPYYIYDRSGIYDVKLTAYNEAGEEAKTESVTIHKPTVLGFLVFDSTGENILAGADVLIYDNDYDWEFKPEQPLMSDVTDNSGLVLFENMEPIVYYIIVFKEEANGAWIFPGQTPTAIIQNEVNLFNVPCVWVGNQKKATVYSVPELKDSGLRQLRKVAD